MAVVLTRGGVLQASCVHGDGTVALRPATRCRGAWTAATKCLTRGDVECWRDNFARGGDHEAAIDALSGT